MSLDRMQSVPGMTYITPLPDSSGYPGGVTLGGKLTVAPATAATASGGAICLAAPASQTIAGSGTISHANSGKVIVTAAGVVASVVLQAGTVDGQTLDIVNTQAGANTITFAVAATSNVADGATTIMAGLRAYRFIWDTTTARWYRAG